MSKLKIRVVNILGGFVIKCCESVYRSEEELGQPHDEEILEILEEAGRLVRRANDERHDI